MTARALCAAVCLAAALGPSPAAAGMAGPVTVFAAASLTDPFTALGRVLERRHPGLRIVFNFAGSQQLAAQIEQGARADVFASADQRWMDYLARRRLLAAAPVEFARNVLVVIVPRANPARIGRLQDLAGPGVKIVLAADAVPAGRYARQALEHLGRAPGFPPGYARSVLRNVVSEEDSVRGVVAKVEIGEADAGIVYRSDAGAVRRVRILEIPQRYNVTAAYPIAVLRGAPNPAGAAAFVDLVLSRPGQRLLRDHNFLPVRAP